MAETQANRLAGGWKVYLALAGTTDDKPTLAGTTAPSFGTMWAEVPGMSAAPKFKMAFKAEGFRRPFDAHNSDEDVVDIGLEEVAFESKETDIEHEKVALLSTLYASTKSLKQPLESTDLPMMQMACVCKGPGGMWKVRYIPRCKRKFDVAQRDTGKVGVLPLAFSAFCVTDSTIIEEGKTFIDYESVAA